MSSQKFNAVVREALWIAHSKKCAYTQELIDLGSMQIDHVIPEKVAQSHHDLARIKATLGLAPDFDPFGFENLLPTKAGANRQKNDLVLNPSAAHFFLSIAAAKKPQAERNVERINKRIQTGRAFIILQQLLESGVVQPADVASILAGSPDEVFKLVAALDFADQTQVQSVSKAELDELRRRPIKLGANDHLDGLTLGRESGEEAHVRTCLEYEAALHAGYYARTTFEMKMSVFFEHQCGLLSALSRATLPTRSHFSEPRVGLPDLQLLPFALFPNIGERAEPEAVTDQSTYQDKVDAGVLRVKRVGSTLLNIEEPEGMGQHLVEVIRADFDGDGLEEILVFEYCYATHGTLGFGGIRLLSRKAGQGLLEVSAI
jgi:hypothetical protein